MLVGNVRCQTSLQSNLAKLITKIFTYLINDEDDNNIGWDGYAAMADANQKQLIAIGLNY